MIVSQGNGFSLITLFQDDLAFTGYALTSTNVHVQTDTHILQHSHANSLHHAIFELSSICLASHHILRPQHWVWVFRDSLFFRAKKRWKLLVDCFPYSKLNRKQTSLEETTNNLMSIRGIYRSRWWFHISLFYLFVKVEVHESQFQRLVHMFWNRMA